MRSVMATLRDGGADFEPLRGLGDLDELVASSRATGLAVNLTLDDDADSIPRQLGAAVYRVAREALTNVIRHARASRIDIVVALDGANLELTVIDDGEGPPRAATRTAGAGHGIDVMRERVEALGGTLTAAPRESRGFRVCARFPVEGAR